MKTIGHSFFPFLLLVFLLIACSRTGGKIVYLKKLDGDQFQLISKKDKNKSSWSLKVQFKNGTPNGQATLLNPQRKKIRQGHLKSVDPFIWEGNHIKYNEDESIHFKGQFTENERHGVFKYFYKDGTLKQICTYKHGKVHGLLTIFMPDGLTIQIQEIWSKGRVIDHGLKLESSVDDKLRQSDKNQRMAIGLIWETKDFLDKKKYRKALEIINEFLHLYPGHLLMQEYRADALLHSGKFDEALKQYEKIENTHPRKYQILKKIAEAYTLKSDFKKAIVIADRCIEKAQQKDFLAARQMQAEASKIKGNIYLYQANNRKAIQSFSQALTAFESNQNYNARALAYMQINQDKNALNDLNQSIKLNHENNNKAYISRAALYAQNGKMNKAKADLNKINIKEFNWIGFRNGAIIVTALALVVESTIAIMKFEVVFLGCLLQTFFSAVFPDVPIAALLKQLTAVFINKASPTVVGYILDVSFGQIVETLDNKGYGMLANVLETGDFFHCLGSQPTY